MHFGDSCKKDPEWQAMYGQYMNVDESGAFSNPTDRVVEKMRLIGILYEIETKYYLRGERHGTEPE